LLVVVVGLVEERQVMSMPTVTPRITMSFLRSAPESLSGAEVN
jgi:hypothetical protein